MGKYLIASTRKLQWEQQMWENEVEMRKELLQRNEETLHFLEQEKLKLVAEENFAEASLVKEEIAALRTETIDLEKDLKAIKEAKATGKALRKQNVTEEESSAEVEVHRQAPGGEMAGQTDTQTVKSNQSTE